MTDRNEAAERLRFKQDERRRIADLHPGVEELIAEERAAERRATVERIRAGLLRVPSAPAWSEEVFAILDEEAAR